MEVVEKVVEILLKNLRELRAKEEKKKKRRKRRGVEI